MRGVGRLAVRPDAALRTGARPSRALPRGAPTDACRRSPAASSRTRRCVRSRGSRRPRAKRICCSLRVCCTASQFERSIRAYRRVSTAEARRQQDDAHLSVFWNSDGSLEIHGRLAPEDGALFLRAIESMRDSLWRGSAEPRPARQASTAEALVAVADAALAGGERTGGTATRSWSTLTRPCCEDGEGGCALEDGSARRAGDRTSACVRRVGRARRPQVADDPLLVAPGFTRARSRLSLPRLREPPVRRRAPRPPLGTRRETTLGNLVSLCRRHHRPCTRAGIASTPMVASSIRGAARYPPRPRSRAATHARCPSTAGSRSMQEPASTAPASRWISQRWSTRCLRSTSAGIPLARAWLRTGDKSPRSPPSRPRRARPLARPRRPLDPPLTRRA